MNKQQIERLQILKAKKENGVKTLKIAFIAICTVIALLIATTFWAYFIKQVQLSTAFLFLPTIITIPAFLLINRLKRLKEEIDIIDFQLSEFK